MPVAWDQFEAVDEPAVDWANFEPDESKAAPEPAGQVDWANFEPDLSPEQEAKKADLQKQMSRARLGGKVSKAGEIAADVAQRVAYTASLMDPITAVGKVINPQERRVVSPEQMQSAIDYFNPLGTPAEGSVGQGAEQFGAELASGFTQPEIAAAALTGKVNPQLAARLFQPGLIRGSGEAVNQLLQAQTPAEATKAGLNVALSAGGALGIEMGLQTPRAPVIPPLTGEILPVRPGARPPVPVKLPRPMVPETPPEPQVAVNVLEEIRQRNLRTTAQIQQAFPARELRREEAAALRRQAWGEAPPIKTPIRPSGVPEPPPALAGQTTPEAPATAPAESATAPAVETPVQLKERTIKQRIKSGIEDKNIRLSVTPDQVFQHPVTGEPVTIPGTVQVDEIHPTLGNTFSSNPAQLKQLGMDIPDASDLVKLPIGQYTLAEARTKVAAMKKAAEPAPAPTAPVAEVAPAQSPPSSPSSPSAPVAEVPVAKEPWQMTEAEYRTHEQRGTWDQLTDEKVTEARTKEAQARQQLNDANAKRKALGNPESIRKVMTDRQGALDRNQARRDADKVIQEARKEFSKWASRSVGRATHEGYVKRAIEAGKPVPPEVLADYPDLQKAGTAEQPAAPAPKPESVQEQQARLEAEKSAAGKQAQTKAVAERASAPLVGSVGDIGQGDLLGGGDLFSQKPKPAVPGKGEMTGMAGPGSPSATQGADVGGPQEAQLLDALRVQAPGSGGRDAPTISIADRLAEAVAHNKGVMAKWWLRTKAGAEQYKRLILGAPRTEDSFWSVKKDWVKNRQVNNGVARELIAEGKRLVPKQLHRQAMGKYAEAMMLAGDPESGFKTAQDVLTHWADNAKLPSNRAQYEAALKLTPEQMANARQMIQYFEAKGRELQEAGLLGQMIEDYAGQHMVDMRASKPPAALNQLKADLVTGAFNTNFKYALRRLFQTEFDLENAGLTLKTSDLFDKLANYAKSAEDTLADRAAVKGWMEGETADGKPLFATGQHRGQIEGVQNDALLVNPKVRPHPKWTDPATGEETDISGEYVKVDHPAFRKWQWAETVIDPETGKPRQFLVQGDVWAHRSIADELKNTFGRSRLYDIPGVDTATRINAQLKGLKLVGLFHQTKTASHALFHLTNPVGQPKINPHDAFTQDAMRSGLQLFESHNQEIFSEGLASGSVLQGLANLPKTATGIDALGFGDRLRAYQEYLFQDYIPRIKLATYRNVLRRNLDRYGKTLDANQIRQISSTQVNSAYGEMNWRLLGINPTFRHFLRLSLLAPDFQAAQHGFAAQIFTRYGAEQRMAAAIMIAGTYTVARVLNQIFDNDPHFQLRHAFSVVHGGREYGIRTIATDAQRALTDTATYVYHRLSPIASSISEEMTRVNAFGRKETAMQAHRNVAERALPIPVTPRTDIGFVENAVASTLGFYAKRHSAATDVYDLARTWRKANDPNYSTEAVQFPQSKYGSLRQMLQDNDLAGARKEYNRLAKTIPPNRIIQTIRTARPFTGARSMESKFISELTLEQKKLYDAAVSERRVVQERFNEMLRMPRGNGSEQPSMAPTFKSSFIK